MAHQILEEILIEIFKRLPVKSLVRFRCVCKSWYSLITNHSFISMHTKHTIGNTTNNNTMLLIHSVACTPHKKRYTIHLDEDSFSEYQEVDSPFKTQGHDDYSKSAGSCNGLLCLYENHVSNPKSGMFWFIDNPASIMLWNPAIRKSVTPQIPSITFDGKHKAVLGFGFDSKTNDYKVVRLVYRYEHMSTIVPLQVELYELSTNAWRSINATAPPYIISASSSRAFLHGAVHWLGQDPSKDVGGFHKRMVVSFDMEDEVFREMELPDVDRAYSICLIEESLMVSVQSLVLIECITSINYQICDIWVMKEYGVAESWAKQFTIPLGVKQLATVLGFRRNGEVLLADNGGELVSYDPEMERVTPLGVYGFINSFYVETYEESLILLEGVNKGQIDSCDSVTDKGAKVSFNVEDTVQ